MSQQCPACQSPASAVVTVSMGDSWQDTFGKPPHSLLSEYQMVHVGGTDGQSLVVFLHTQKDMQ